MYERGLEALQRHDYQVAAGLLESVLRTYPEEKELHERVRLYLNICQRHVAPREASPQTVEERLYASTLAINGGRYDEAISHLRLVRDEDPDNDHALYTLAVAHAQRGEHAEAIAPWSAPSRESRESGAGPPRSRPRAAREDDASGWPPDSTSTRPVDRRRPIEPNQRDNWADGRSHIVVLAAGRDCG